MAAIDRLEILRMTTAEIIAWMKGLSDQERAQVFTDLAEEYCIYCGRYHGDQLRACQCSNDE